MAEAQMAQPKMVEQMAQPKMVEQMAQPQMAEAQMAQSIGAPGPPDIKPQITAALNAIDTPEISERIGSSLGKVLTPFVQGNLSDNKNGPDWERRDWRRRDDPSGPRPSGAYEGRERKRGGPLRMIEAGVTAIMDVRDMLNELNNALIRPPGMRREREGMGGEHGDHSGRPQPQAGGVMRSKGNPRQGELRQARIPPPQNPQGSQNSQGLYKPQNPEDKPTSALDNMANTLKTIGDGIKAAKNAIPNAFTTPQFNMALNTLMKVSEAIPNIDSNVTTLVASYKAVNGDAITAAQATANAATANAATANAATANEAPANEAPANDAQEGGRRRRGTKRAMRNKRKRGTRR